MASLSEPLATLANIPMDSTRFVYVIYGMDGIHGVFDDRIQAEELVNQANHTQYRYFPLSVIQFEINKSGLFDLIEQCKQAQSMSFWQSRLPEVGDFARFTKAGGTTSEQEFASDFLVDHSVYIVEDVEIGGWRSTIRLVGVPHKFNSVLFLFANNINNIA